MPPSRRVHPARQVSASGRPPEPLRFERRGVSSCRGRRALRRGRGRAPVNTDQAPSRSSSAPQWLRGESTSSQPSFSSEQLTLLHLFLLLLARPARTRLGATPPARSQEAGAEPRVGTRDVTPAREAGLGTAVQRRGAGGVGCGA